MKRILYILLVAFAWGMTAQAQPKAEFDKKAHQFGTILWKNLLSTICSKILGDLIL